VEHQWTVIGPDAAEQVRRLRSQIDPISHQKKPSLSGL
jgi:hypothetical protein